MTVALVTDSTAYLTAQRLREAPVPVAVVPLRVAVAGVEYHEGVDIDTSRLAEAMQAFQPVSTSGPAPRAILQRYREAAAAGASEIVSTHLSGDLSGTIQAARLAAAESPVPVTVVDSRSLGMAMGFAVLSGAAAAAAGASGGQVADVVSQRSRAATVVFYVHTLEYLRRGGRIGAAAALVGSALSVKPILSLQDGRIEPRERVRTGLRAMARMADLASEGAHRVARSGRGFDVAVQHLELPERAEQLQSTLRERLPEAGEIEVSQMGPVAGAHVGPGALVVVVSPRPRSATSW